MQLNSNKVNNILRILALVIIVGAVVSYFFLNDAQRIVVGIGAVLALVNLLGLGYFFNKNTGRRR